MADVKVRATIQAEGFEHGEGILAALGNFAQSMGWDISAGLEIMPEEHPPTPQGEPSGTVAVESYPDERRRITEAVEEADPGDDEEYLRHNYLSRKPESSAVEDPMAKVRRAFGNQ